VSRGKLKKEGGSGISRHNRKREVRRGAWYNSQLRSQCISADESAANGAETINWFQLLRETRTLRYIDQSNLDNQSYLSYWE
jgi:hypothetical protein